MHHLGITPPIRLVEQTENLLLKRLAVLVYRLPSLPTPNQHYNVSTKPSGTYLVGVRKIYFLRDSPQPPEDDSNLASPLLALFTEGFQAGGILPRELVVAIDEVVCSFGAFAVLVHRFQLFT